MSDGVDITVTGLNELIGRLDGAPRIIQDEMTTAMKKGRLIVQGEAQRTVVKDTRTLTRSMGYGAGPNKVVSMIGEVRGVVGSNLEYARPVEFGRRPGAPMPPEPAMRRWARRKGIPEKSLFALRLKIARDGIRARPFLEPALAAKRTAVKAELQAGVRRAATRIARGG